MVIDSMTTALAAMRVGRWTEAAEAFRHAIAETDDPRAHDGLAQAAWWLDDAETALAAREAGYRGFRAAGDDRAAARSAATLGYDSMLFGHGVAVGRGWLARSADLLDGQPDLPENGWLAVRQAEVALAVDHDALSALDHARAAEALGRASGDHNLVFVGQAVEGLSLVRLGDVAGGMALLDASAGAATAGDLDDLMWMGKVCCWLIYACHEAGDLARAETWCTRVAEICVAQDLEPLFSVCRIQYASVLLAQGDSEGAEAALDDALDRLDGSKRVARLEAVAQLGELRRRQGRDDEAERLLAQAGFQPPAVISLSRLRLAQGDVDRAWSTISELVRSLPNDTQLDRVDALAVFVEVGVAAGHLEPAREAAAEIREMAGRVCTDAMWAMAAAAEARVAEGSTVVAHWQDAIRHATAAGLLFEEADHRLDLADVLVAEGARDEARDHAAAAVDRFHPLGGGPGTTRALAILGEEIHDVPLTGRQVDVIRLLAGGSSNAEIASELFLSEHTVHRHVANIYSTLGIRTRAAAAVYAVGHDLV